MCRVVCNKRGSWDENVGWVGCNGLFGSHTSIKMTSRSGKRCPTAKEPLRSNHKTEEVNVAAALALGGEEPQDVPEDKLSDANNKFDLAENDELKQVP